MNQRKGAMWGLIAVICFCVLKPSNAYAEEVTNAGELLTFIVAFDSNDEMCNMSSATPIYVSERDTVFITPSYVVNNEKEVTYYAVVYLEEGNIVNRITCYYQDEEYGFVAFRTNSDAEQIIPGYNCASINELSVGDEVIYFGLNAEEEFATKTNYFAGANEKGIASFQAECSDAIKGSPVFDEDVQYVVGMLMDENSFITMDEVFPKIFHENSNDTGLEDSGNSDDGLEDSDIKNKMNISFPILIGIGAFVILAILVIVLSSNKKKKKPNQDSEILQSIPQSIPQSVPETDPFIDKSITFNLIGIGGVHAGVMLEIKEPIVFGRDKNRCNLMFLSQTQGISSVHCQINFINGKVELIDLGSSYGTYLDDGTKLTPHVPVQLEKGQGFYLADRKYSYRIG